MANELDRGDPSRTRPDDPLDYPSTADPPPGQTLMLYDPWAAAYALATGVRLIKVLSGRWPEYVFEDASGQASRALGEWRQGRAMVSAKSYASAYRQVRRLTQFQPSPGTTEEATTDGTTQRAQSA